MLVFEPVSVLERPNGKGPIGRPQLSDDAAVYIRELIMAGELRPGQFVRIDGLAAELGISVTPVRQALVTLRGEGFVHLEPRRGFVISPLSEEDIRDLFRIQAFVAGEVAAYATKNATPEELNHLRQIVIEIERANKEDDVMAEERLAHEFHEVLAESAHRPKLAWLLELSSKYEPRRFYADLPGWRRIATAEHRTILTALEEGNSETAQATMQSHVEHLGEIVAQHFASNEGSTNKS